MSSPGPPQKCRAPGCGKDFPPDTKFCPACGTPTVGDTKQEMSSPGPPQQCRAPGCGKDFPPDTKFCPACGTPAGSAGSAYPQSMPGGMGPTQMIHPQYANQWQSMHPAQQMAYPNQPHPNFQQQWAAAPPTSGAYGNTGYPSGYPPGNPSGYPPGNPSGYPPGYPPGNPPGYPTGNPSGYPLGNTSGYPRGYRQGYQPDYGMYRTANPNMNQPPFQAGMEQYVQPPPGPSNAPHTDDLPEESTNSPDSQLQANSAAEEPSQPPSYGSTSGASTNISQHSVTVPMVSTPQAMLHSMHPIQQMTYPNQANPNLQQPWVGAPPTSGAYGNTGYPQDYGMPGTFPPTPTYQNMNQTPFQAGIEQHVQLPEGPSSWRDTEMKSNRNILDQSLPTAPHATMNIPVEQASTNTSNKDEQPGVPMVSTQTPQAMRQSIHPIQQMAYPNQANPNLQQPWAGAPPTTGAYGNTGYPPDYGINREFPPTPTYSNMNLLPVQEGIGQHVQLTEGLSNWTDTSTRNTLNRSDKSLSSTTQPTISIPVEQVTHDASNEDEQPGDNTHIQDLNVPLHVSPATGEHSQPPSQDSASVMSNNTSQQNNTISHSTGENNDQGESNSQVRATDKDIYVDQRQHLTKQDANLVTSLPIDSFEPDMNSFCMVETTDANEGTDLAKLDKLNDNEISFPSSLNAVDDEENSNRCTTPNGACIAEKPTQMELSRNAQIPNDNNNKQTSSNAPRELVEEDNFLDNTREIPETETLTGHNLRSSAGQLSSGSAEATTYIVDPAAESVTSNDRHKNSESSTHEIEDSKMATNNLALTYLQTSDSEETDEQHMGKDLDHDNLNGRQKNANAFGPSMDDAFHTQQESGNMLHNVNNEQRDTNTGFDTTYTHYDPSVTDAKTPTSNDDQMQSPNNPVDSPKYTMTTHNQQLDSVSNATIEHAVTRDTHHPKDKHAFGEDTNKRVETGNTQIQLQQAKQDETGPITRAKANRDGVHISQNEHQMAHNTRTHARDKQPAQSTPQTSYDNSKTTPRNHSDASCQGESIHVLFRVMVSKLFQFDPTNYQMTIQFHNANVYKEYFLEFKKNAHTREDGSCDQFLMSVDLVIPNEIVGNKNRIQYRYVMYDNDNKWVKNEQIPGLKCNDLRQLQLFNDDTTGIIIKNDIVTFPPVAWYRYDQTSTMIREVSWGVKAVLPLWKELKAPRTRAGDVIENILQLSNSAKRLLETGCYSKRAEWSKSQKQILKEYIASAITELITFNQRDRPLDEDDVTYYLSMSLVVITLSSTLNIRLKPESRTALCQTLKLRSDDGHLYGYDGLKHHFYGDHWSKATGQLLTFMKCLCQKEYIDPCWVLCIPLLHFMMGDSSPGEPLPVYTTHKSIQWWGTSDIEQSIDNFKKNAKSIPATLYLHELKPLFMWDRLLPRTLTAICGYENAADFMGNGPHEIGPEIVLANVFYIIKTQAPSIVRQDTLLNVLQKTCDLIDIKASDSGSNRKMIPTALHNACDIQLQIACDTITSITEKVIMLSNNEILMTATHILGTCIRISEGICDGECPSPSEQSPNITAAFNALHFTINVWLSHSLPPKPWIRWRDNNRELDPDEIKIFNRLANMKFKNGQRSKTWLRSITDIFVRRLKSLENAVMIDVYTNQDLSGCHAAINNCFIQTAFEAIDNLGQRAMDILSNNREGHAQKRTLQLLSRVFATLFPVERDTMSVLTHALTWKSFPLFIEIGDQQKADVCLEQETITLLNIAKENLHMVITEILNGLIEVRKMAFVQEHRKQFLALVSALGKYNNCFNTDSSYGYATATEVHEVFEQRLREMAAFEDERQRLRVLKRMCGSFIHLNTKPLDACLEDSIRQRPLSDLIQPWVLVKDKQLPKTLSMKLIDLPPTILAILEPLSHYERSSIFNSIWRGYGEKIHDDSLSTIATDIWEPSYREVQSLFLELRNGTLSLRAVTKYFDNFNKRPNDLLRELLLFIDDTELAELRSEQIQQYQTLNQIKDCAVAIVSVQKYYNLTGDFEKVKRLETVATDDNQELGSINKDVIEAGKLLLDIEQYQIDCLHEFSRCHGLVVFLRQLAGGATEAKHLVNHAMDMAQGQGDEAQERVTCLDTVINGFAPLIFDLNINSNFDQFLSQCKLVWQAVNQDNELPTKLFECSCGLEWLKEMKECVGSVETNAITEAENINNHGIYKVGCNQSESESKNIDGVIQLIIPVNTKRHFHSDHTSESESKNGQEVEKVRHYSLTDLRDLQNKLMLVAGQSGSNKAVVDKFVEVLDGVTRLANVYIELGSAGSIIFKHWRSVFYCQPDRPVNCNIDFGLSELILHGYSNGNVNVLQQVLDMCQFLESCHHMWVDHVEGLRKKYSALNYFTTQQLVTLRSELVKLCCEFPAKGQAPLNNGIFPLLQLVKVNSTEQELREAIVTALIVIHDREEAEANRKACLEPVPSDKNTKTMGESRHGGTDDITLDAAKEMLEELLVMFPRKLVTRAINSGIEDADEGWTWCMSHLDEISNDDENLSHEDVPETGAFHVEKSLKDMMKELLTQIQPTTQAYCLKTHLEKLWQTYMLKASSTVTDYLSVEHLGLILEHLEDQDNEEIGRLFEFMPDQPNLVLCPERELLSVVLSMYYTTEEKSLPLPRADEVLLCTPTTTSEEVDLLLRRSTTDKRGKLYCIAGADILPIKVARQVEASFNRHTSSKYQLVVVCCEERESSYLVNILERCRVTTTQEWPSHSVLCDYLRRHFTMKDGHDEVYTAASLDPENICVRLVKSHRAGMGKSLKVNQIAQTSVTNAKERPPLVKIPLLCPKVDVENIVLMMSPYADRPEEHVPRVYHIDIAYEVDEGVDYLLFNLLILGSVTGRDGHMWHRSNYDLYLIENLPMMTKEAGAQCCLHQVLDLLPSVTCWSPEQCLTFMEQTENSDNEPQCQPNDQLIDMNEFESKEWQRPYAYLKCLSINGDLNKVEIIIKKKQGSPTEKLRILLTYCGIDNPAWTELSNFAHFLNEQMLSFEDSDFCKSFLDTDGTLPGFWKFVLRFMIQMSRDFATRSLLLSEEAIGDGGDLQNRLMHRVEVEYQLKRNWESSPHPYIFFNRESHAMTFLGFKVSPNGDIMDPNTDCAIERGVLSRDLMRNLKLNFVDLNENFDKLERKKQINKICQVMGIQTDNDTWEERYNALDPTYVLTSDNAKKILAIYMRFRCGIPVIVMGETGCGKTRLIKFMCDLQKPTKEEIKNMVLKKLTVEETTKLPLQKPIQEEITNEVSLKKPIAKEITNMVLMKVHGGTTEDDICHMVTKAAKLAEENYDNYEIDTVLFLDEANTTEAIGLIKEIMCDHTVNGQLLPKTQGLKLVAACNPYKKHNKDMIDRLKKAGLGYHMNAESNHDRLDGVPLRELVYRVKRLPQSMRRLIWDFGHLSNDTEKEYIEKIVKGFTKRDTIPNLEGLNYVLTDILGACQEYMKKQEHECSYVSLRDVERSLTVMEWFYTHRVHLYPLIDALDESSDSRKDAAGRTKDEQNAGHLTRSLVLALGVCYYSRLEDRLPFCEYVAEHFKGPLVLQDKDKAKEIEITIIRCQTVFLKEVKPGKTIAKNMALRENFFMMVVCSELRIPLFLVGKPGSSKSLAKTIISNAMVGPISRSYLFKHFKSMHMTSFQCSQVSTPEGIVATFRQCALRQKNKDLNTTVAVVVLDEIGLAEDSPKMPLKTLHPLLEDGCEANEEPEPYKKVGFIGISNWALDPAKMNRGIFVQRGVPNRKELFNTAKEICETDVSVQHVMPYLNKAASCYLTLCEQALEKEGREYFGLRDFYSFMKLLYAFSAASNNAPTWAEIRHAILRNFGGIDSIDPVRIFEKELQDSMNIAQTAIGPDCSPPGLVKATLQGLDGIKYEGRYLLVLTENNAAVECVQEQLPDATVIYGSSFPKDQDYTQLCRNINTIKVCMELGRPVVLLKLDSLYESLYDALNQYYSTLFGKRFVYLGLGTQRVNVKVDPKFKLAVVADKKSVLKKFPIPLINRLEKQFISVATLLSEEQKVVAKRFKTWAQQFAKVISDRRPGLQPKTADVFIGYSDDTSSFLILQACKLLNTIHPGDQSLEQVMECAQGLLLSCATPDAVLRLSTTALNIEDRHISLRYFTELHHGGLQELVTHQLQTERLHPDVFLQVTTHSRLLTKDEVLKITRNVALHDENVWTESLNAFDTEQQFYKTLHDFYCSERVGDRLLVLQCDDGDQCAELINCARYYIRNRYSDTSALRVDADSHWHLLFIIKLPRISGGCFVGFQGWKWMCYHVDDLLPDQELEIPLHTLSNRAMSSLFNVALKRLPAKEHDDLISDGEALTSLNGHNETALGEIKFDIDKLIHRCLHPAVSCLQDPPGREQRKALRLEILVDLFNDSKDNTGLLYVVKHRVAHLLEDKELNHTGYQLSRRWLQDAVGFDTVHRIGTCRRALRQYIDSKSTPLLTTIFTFIDTNDNLDILVDHPGHSWVHQLWLDMFVDLECTSLTYSALKALVKGPEIPMRHTGLEGSHFSARLPFSWLIKDKLDVMVLQLRLARDVDSHISRETKLMQLIENITLGVVLDTSLRRNLGSSPAVVKMYLHDFVHMVYGAQAGEHADIEYCLVQDMLEKSAHELWKLHQEQHQPQQQESLQLQVSDLADEMQDSGDEQTRIDPEEEEQQQKQQQKQETQPEFELTLPGVHLTYDLVAPRLQALSHLLHSAPQLLPLICEDIADNKIIQNIDMPVDVAALHLAFTHCLQPSRDHLKTAALRRAWMERVEQLQPSIEHALVTLEAASTGGGLGQGPTSTINMCREMWTRVTVLKLFITHVCPSDKSGNESLSVLRCMPLYMSLGGKADFKKASGLEAVEKFLQMSNKSASQVFYGSELKECESCHEPMQDPMKLPCGHINCKQCVLNTIYLFEQLQCPRCKAKLPGGLDGMDIEEQATQLHTLYRQRCNGFFMEVVSRLCFAGGTAPETAVLEKLMGYVTRTSKPAAKLEDRRHVPITQTRSTLTVFDDSIDPTPVVRSLLLQLMLQSRADEVEKYLEKYFNNLRTVLSDPTNTVNLCVLFVYCLEDHYETQYLSQKSSTADTENLRRLLLRARNLSFGEGLSIQKLQGLAAARCALKQVASVLHKRYIGCAVIDHPGAVDGVIEAAKKLCSVQNRPGIEKPSEFLLKHLMVKYGLSVIQKLVSSENTNWIIPAAEIDAIVDLQIDQFAFLGECYKTLRDEVTKVIMGEVDTSLAAVVKSMDDERLMRRCLLLALFRQVTCGYMQQPDHQPNQQNIQRLKETLVAEKINLGAMGSNLLDNNLSGKGNHFKLCPATSQHDLQLLELAVHWQLLMEGVSAKNLLHPLVLIATKPDNMKQAYFPTMPQDDVDEIQKALRGQGATVWKCPKGHRFIVGNCGNPEEGGKCMVCGDNIGKINNKPAPGTKKMDGVQDDTQPGHILGAPQDRASKISLPERKLTPAATAAVRALLHLSLLHAATVDQEATASLIHPKPENLVPFLWAHLGRDLVQLGGAMGLSHDDSVLTLHLMIDQAARIHDLGLGEIDGQLKTKQSRCIFEENIATNYVNSTLKNIHQHLAQAKGHQASDKRLPKSPLVKRLYAGSAHEEWDNDQIVECAPAIWSHRDPVTVELLTQILDQHVQETKCGDDVYAILKAFLQQERHLAALQYLPDIVRLQRGLCQRLHHRMDSSQAKKTTVLEFLEKLPDDTVRNAFNDQIQQLFAAWEIVRLELDRMLNENRQFVFFVMGEDGSCLGSRTVPKNLLDAPLTTNSTIATLLPSANGPGLVSLGLVHYLVSVHNNLISQYSRLRKRRMGAPISVQEVTVAHLVAYDRDRDLIPLLLANCTYWMQAGQSTEHKYDFSAMQRQIEERFIRSRTEVKLKVPLMIYSAALTSAKIFKQLNEKIEQVAIPQTLLAHISHDRDLLSLNDCLATLDMAQNFLVSTGGTPESLLVDYVSLTLKLDCAALRERAARCQLQHTRALWITLSHDRAKLLFAHGQNPFDTVDEEYLKEVDAVAAKELNQLLQNVNARALLAQLYECIVLWLTAPADTNAEDYVEFKDRSLGVLLASYLDDQDIKSPPALSDGRFPAGILAGHCVDTWRIIYRFTTTNQLD